MLNEEMGLCFNELDKAFQHANTDVQSLQTWLDFQLLVGENITSLVVPSNVIAVSDTKNIDYIYALRFSIWEKKGLTVSIGDKVMENLKYSPSPLLIFMIPLKSLTGVVILSEKANYVIAFFFVDIKRDSSYYVNVD